MLSGFAYSPRVVCTMVVSGLVLYKVMSYIRLSMLRHEGQHDMYVKKKACTTVDYQKIIIQGQRLC